MIDVVLMFIYACYVVVNIDIWLLWGGGGGGLRLITVCYYAIWQYVLLLDFDS